MGDDYRPEWRLPRAAIIKTKDGRKPPLPVCLQFRPRSVLQHRKRDISWAGTPSSDRCCWSTRFLSGIAGNNRPARQVRRINTKIVLHVHQLTIVDGCRATAVFRWRQLYGIAPMSAVKHSWGLCLDSESLKFIKLAYWWLGFR